MTVNQYSACVLKIWIAILCLAGIAGAASANTLFTGLRVEEYQPRLPFGGRVNAIAIHPDRFEEALAATDSGGLFRTFDGGETWSPVDSLPAVFTRDVHYITDEQGTWILVTAEADFENRDATGLVGTVTGSNGGIWISRDNGGIWTHPDNAVPRANVTFPSPADDIRCPPDVSAFGADVDSDSNRVFVATDCGVSFTDDSGATWEHVFIDINTPVTADNRRFYTVAALDGPGAILGGADGVFYSEKNGEQGSWFRSGFGTSMGNRSLIGGSENTHAAGRVDGLAGAAYIVAPATPGTRLRDLWRSADNGKTWVLRRGDAPEQESPGCGGIVHVYAFRVPDVFGPGDDAELVFYGNRCESYYLRGRGTGPQRIEGTHTDTRALAFTPGTLVPKYLASDGGLDRSLVDPFSRSRSFWESSNWEGIGSGPNKLNALQIYTVAGQAVLGTDEYRLAIGTQDNKLWSSNDDGVTWPPSQAAEPEGGNIQMQRRIVPGERDIWTYWRCFDCERKISEPMFQNREQWPGIASRSGCAFRYFGKFPFANGLYGKTVVPQAGGGCDTSVSAFDLTRNFGSTYENLYSFTTDETPIQGVPHVGLSAYFPIGTGTYRATATNGNDGQWDTTDIRLRRVDNIVFPPTDSRAPAMNNCDKTSMPRPEPFGSLGVKTYEFDWSAIFGSDFLGSGTLIAPDVRYDRVMITKDGGECWSEMRDLSTIRITQDGKYRFSWLKPDSSTTRVRSLVSAVSFFPENSEFVVIGLRQGGIYISADEGTSWSLIPNSERVYNISDFHWKSANEIYVATFGRGLWKVSYISTFRLMDIIPPLNGAPGQSTFLNRLSFIDSPIITSLNRGSSLPNNGKNGEPELLLTALQEKKLDAVLLVVDGHIIRVKKRKKEDKPLTDRIQLSAGAALFSFTSQETPPTDNPNAVSPLGLEMNGKDYAVLQERILNPPNAETSKPNERGNTERPKIIGLGFQNGEFIGVIAGPGITYAAPELVPVKFPPEVPTNPPVNDRPYVNVTGPSSGFGVLPGDTIKLSGVNFEDEFPVEIIIDNEIVANQISPNKEGRFEAVVPLQNFPTGEYRLEVRQQATQLEHIQILHVLHSDEEVEP